MLSCPICLESVFASGFDQINLVCPPCGHIFHSTCLDEWCTGNQTCPKCRLTFVRSDLRRLYFDLSSEAIPRNAGSFLLAEELRKKNELLERLKTVMTSVSYESSMIRRRNNYLKEEIEKQKLSQSVLREENNKLILSHERLNYELHGKTKLLGEFNEKLNNLKWIEDLVHMSSAETQFGSLLNKSDIESLKVAVYHFKRETKKLTDLCDSKDCIIRGLNDENRDLVMKCEKFIMELKRQDGMLNILKKAHGDSLKSCKRGIGHSRTKFAESMAEPESNDFVAELENRPEEPQPSTSREFHTLDRNRKTEFMATNPNLTPTHKDKAAFKIVSSRRTMQHFHDMDKNK